MGFMIARQKGIVKGKNWKIVGKQKFDEEGNDGGLLFQFYAPRYCLRQTLCLKEKQKGQSIYLLARRCLLSFVSAEEGTDLSDAPTKAMLRILRYAPRQVICERHIRGLPARSR